MKISGAINFGLMKELFISSYLLVSRRWWLDYSRWKIWHGRYMFEYKINRHKERFKFQNLKRCFQVNAIFFLIYLKWEIFISNSNGETTKKQRGFQLYKLGDFRVRGHQLSKERCCGTISDLVRKLTIDINGKDEVGAQISFSKIVIFWHFRKKNYFIQQVKKEESSIGATIHLIIEEKNILVSLRQLKIRWEVRDEYFIY